MRSIALIPFVCCLFTLSSLAQAQSGCEVSITGSANVTIKGLATSQTLGGIDTSFAQRMSVSTDYWRSDAELRRDLEAAAKAVSDHTPIEQKMKADPRISILVINCGNADVILQIKPRPFIAKYADIPFKPGKYELGSSSSAKVLDVQLVIKNDGKPNTYRLAEPGSLELSQFDGKGLTGTFNFKAKGLKPGLAVTVAGKFHFDCRGDNCAK